MTNYIKRFKQNHKIIKAQQGIPLLPSYNSIDIDFADNPDYVETKKNSEKQYYNNIIKESISLLYNGLSLFDPTGITSWPDVYKSIKDAIKDGEISGEEALSITWSVLGALPMIGKVTAPVKLAKMASKVFSRNKKIATSVLKFLNNGNEVIDTLPEYIPFMRGASANVQDFTSKGVNALMSYAPWIAKNNKDYVNIAYGLNRTADVLNILNTSSDFSQIFNNLQQLYYGKIN